MTKIKFTTITLFISVLLFISVGSANAQMVQPSGAVRGTVSDASTGQPIPGAYIFTKNPITSGSYRYTVTDSTGHYLLTGLSAGSTIIYAQKNGYIAANQTVGIIAHDTVTANFALVSIVPPARGAIQGTVTNASTGDPLVGAEVSARFSNVNSWTLTHTDSTGHYLLNNLAVGSTVVVAEKSGFSSGHQTIEVLANNTVVADFALVPIFPPAQGAVQGTVTNASTGSPIIGAYIYARPVWDLTYSGAMMGTDSHSNYFAVTDSTGHYLLNNLSVGSTLIVADKYGFESGKKTMVVLANNTVTADFALIPVIPPAKGAIQGTVTNTTSGEPLAGVLIHAKSSTDFDLSASFNKSTNNRPESQFAVTDSTGYYLLDNLIVGDYNVTASKYRFISQTKPITVIANNTVTADFSLSPKSNTGKGSIIGTVSDASTGAPIPNAFVFISMDAANWYGHLAHLFTHTDSTGFYQLDNVPAGNRVLKVLKPGYQKGVQQVTVIASDTATANIALIPIPPKATGTITGTVSDASTGSPLVGAHVFVRDNDDDISISWRSNVSFTTTDITGSYSLYSVSTGVRSVVAFDSGYHALEEQANVFANQTTIVDFELVPVGANTTKLNITVVEANTNSANPTASMVIAVNPARIPDATVFIPVDDQILPTSDWDDFWGITTNTGQLTINNVPAETQLIVVSKDGYLPQMVSADLARGTTLLTVSLTPEIAATAVTLWELYQ